MKTQKTRELVIMGVLTGIVFLGQIFMGFLPNVEIVTLLFILYTLVFGKKSISYDLRFCFSGRDFLRFWTLVAKLSLCVECSGNHYIAVQKAEIRIVLECSLWILWNFFWSVVRNSLFFYQRTIRGFRLLGVRRGL